MQDIPEDQSWLSDDELEQFRHFRFPKRQKDWLSGRFVGKSLIKCVVFDARTISWKELSIRNEPEGAPFVQFNQDNLKGSLSLSHRGSYAAAAWCEGEDIAIGIDLEEIESKSTGFIEDYFSERESKALSDLSDDDRNFSASLLWSGKEAILKALKIGLRIDTRKLIFEIPEIQPGEKWNEITILESPAEGENIQLFWKNIGNMIITLAIQSKKQVYKFSPASICQIF